MTPLWELDAHALDTLYRRRDVSPREVVQACLERNDAVHPTLNALILADAEGALAAAAASEQRMLAGTRLGPLDGVPCTVKDNLFVRGLRATWGSRLFESFVPDRDDIVVERLRQAGGCILGKTNTPELALAGRTDNLLFGPTRHPLDPRLTPGGSSGGAVAATAAGIAPLAIGTDAGGSTRLPASYTGLFGLRPSTGRIPRCHGFPSLAHDFQVIGLLTRTARDLATLFGTVAGPDARDRASLCFGHAPTPWRSGRTRVRVVLDVAGEPVDPSVRTAVAQAARRFETAGYDVAPGRAPYDLETVRRCWATLSAAGVARAVRSHPDWRSRVTPDIARIAEAGLAVSAADYVDALDELAGFRAGIAEAWGEDDLILTPSAAVLPWPVDAPHAREVDGRPGSPRSASIFSTWVNAAGLPAISLPLATSADGRPIGVQLVARFGEDEWLLQAALALCGTQT